MDELFRLNNFLDESTLGEMDCLIENVRRDLSTAAEIDSDSIHQHVLRQINNHINFNRWTLSIKRILHCRVFDAINGLGLLEEPLKDNRVTEVMVNGNEGIFVEIKGCIYKWPESFKSVHELERVIHRMLSTIDRVVNTAQPIVDGRLADGSRFHVVMPPIAMNGPIVTIRKFHRQIKTADYLVESGSLDMESVTILKDQVLKRRNILVSGGTGTGKTTLLNILSLWLSPDERIVTVEDACELNLSHLKNWVQLETRQATSDDLGAITMRQLVRASLRMRPDRMIVGEVRGAEVLDMLQAMNTGHEGSMSTVHANSVIDVFSRLETLLHIHTNISIEAIRALIISSLDTIVHLERDRLGNRFVSQIATIDKSSRLEYKIAYCYQRLEDCDEHNKTRNNRSNAFKGGGCDL